MMKIEMQVFYLPVRTTSVDFLYSIKTDTFQSSWDLGKVVHNLTTINSNMQNQIKIIGLMEYAQITGVQDVDSLRDVEIDVVTMKLVKDET